VIAEDHLLVREGMQRILEASRDVEVVAAVADGDALDAAIERERPDVVVTDVRMPPSDEAEGIRVALDGRERYPEMGVLLLSQYADPAYALALFRDGSRGRGYLLKDRLAAPGQLLAAIADVAGGGSVVDPLVVEALVSSRLAAEASPLRTLTGRERQILAELAAGKSNAAIARTLVITRRAVEHHITAIFAKLGLPDETEVSRRVRAALLYLADRDGVTAERAS
jgi:DNA-binding NarL/FixJ family response regulator